MNADLIVTPPAGQLTFTGLSWLSPALNGGLRAGGSYLVGGGPGANKTTLMVQIACDLALQGITVLMILTEQTVNEVKAVIARVCGEDPGDIPATLWQHLRFEVLEHPDRLPSLVRCGGAVRHPDVRVVIVDSLQGRGLPSVATRTYRRIFAFLDRCKAGGLTILLVSHITKAGAIAGPRSLEHKVDVVVVLRQALGLRQLFVAKNRFGPEIVDPVVLDVTGGRLSPSPHAAEHCATALGYAGVDDELVEVQAAVRLPRLNSRPELNAPFLHHKRLRQLLSTLGGLPGIELGELTYSINALVPSGLGYTSPLDLPIAMALLAAYLRVDIPRHVLFVGQLDLQRNIRSPNHAYLEVLADIMVAPTAPRVDTVVLSNACSGHFREMIHAGRDQDGGFIVVLGVSNLGEVLEAMWPDRFGLGHSSGASHD